MPIGVEKTRNSLARPGISRAAVLAAILICWTGGLVAMARRQAADHTDAHRLAVAAARVTPQDIYFLVEQNGEQVGFAASRLDTLDGGFYVADHLMADRSSTVMTPRGPRMRLRRTTLTSRVWLTNTFALRRYIVSSDTGTGETVIQIDPVGDTAVTIAYTPPTGLGQPERRTVRATPLSIAPTLLPLALALGGDHMPHVGSHLEFEELDPVDGPRRVTLSVSADSLFVIPDSAIADSTAKRWKPFSTDTLRAWRIVPDSPLIGGGTPVVEWIDDEGRLVSAAATVPASGPVTLVRTTYELAHDNWSGKNIFFRAFRPQ
jgi:hypothetical protein